jgi:hypothetical protein
MYVNYSNNDDGDGDGESESFPSFIGFRGPKFEDKRGNISDMINLPVDYETAGRIIKVYSMQIPVLSSTIITGLPIKPITGLFVSVRRFTARISFRFKNTPCSILI